MTSSRLTAAAGLRPRSFVVAVGCSSVNVTTIVSRSEPGSPSRTMSLSTGSEWLGITPPSTSGAELDDLPSSVDWLEVRSDLLGDLNPEWLRSHFRGRLLYALRSRAEDGAYSESLQDRHLRLTTAARHYDRVEIEAGTDFSDNLLAKIPVEKRLVSWYGSAERFGYLERPLHAVVYGSSYPLQTRDQSNQAQ